MNKKLKISIGQYSSAGIKAQNQDFHGVYIPEGHALSSKGIACAIADGISSSNVSHIAAETESAVFYRIIIRLQMHGVPKLQRHGSFVRPIPGSMHKPSKAAGVLIKTRVMSAPLVH